MHMIHMLTKTPYTYDTYAAYNTIYTYDTYTDYINSKRLSCIKDTAKPTLNVIRYIEPAF